MDEIQYAQTVAAEEEWLNEQERLENKQMEEDRMLLEEKGIMFGEKK